MVKKRKSKDTSGPKNEWMTSYADMVTVLFALFVMLYALSDVDEALWAEFAIAAAFSAAPPSPFDFAGEGINDFLGSGIMDLPAFDLAVFEFQPDQGREGQQNQMEITHEILMTYFGEAAAVGAIPEGAVQVEFDGYGQILISTHGDIYFDTALAVIRPETFPILDVIASAINNLHGVSVSVEGHTDNRPIRTAQFPDNWALSNARALSILRYLVYEQGVDPDIIHATGFGERRPVRENTTEEGMQANRRVEIRIMEGNN